MSRSTQPPATAQPSATPPVVDWHIEVRHQGGRHRRYAVKVRNAGGAELSSDSFTYERFEQSGGTQSGIFENPQRAEAAGRGLFGLLLTGSLKQQFITCIQQSQMKIRLLLDLDLDDPQLVEAPWECLRCDEIGARAMRERVSIVRLLPDDSSPRSGDEQAVKSTIIIAALAGQGEESGKRSQDTHEAISAQIPSARVAREAAREQDFRARLPKTARLLSEGEMEAPRGRLLRMAAGELADPAVTGLLALMGSLAPAMVRALMEDTRGAFALLTLHEDATGTVRSDLPRRLARALRQAVQHSPHPRSLDFVLSDARRLLEGELIQARFKANDVEKMCSYLPILWVRAPKVLDRHLGWEQPTGELRVESVGFQVVEPAPISALAWHPEEPLLFLADETAAVYAYRIGTASDETSMVDESRDLSAEAGGHCEGIRALLPIPQAADSAERLVYSSSDDSTIRGWTWRGGARRWEASHSITAMAMGPSGELALTTSDGELWFLAHHAQLWEPGVRSLDGLIPESQKKELRGGGLHPSLAFAPRGEWLAVCKRSQEVSLWAVVKGAWEPQPDTEIRDGEFITSVVALSERMLLTGTATGALRMWRAGAIVAHPWTPSDPFPGHQRLLEEAGPPHGEAAEVRWLAYLEGMGLLLVVSPACASLWSVGEHGELAQRAEQSWQPPAAPGFSLEECHFTSAAAYMAPSGAYIALGDAAGQITLFRLQRGPS